jgi:pimeloyl-ACP methyl ester carboxylesterase
MDPRVIRIAIGCPMCSSLLWFVTFSSTDGLSSASLFCIAFNSARLATGQRREQLIDPGGDAMPERRPIDVVFVHGLFPSADVWEPFVHLIEVDPDLSDFVTTHCFSYQSPVTRLRFGRRIPDLDDVADQLRTYLATDLQDAQSIVLVAHSQGGLVVQRMLARTLGSGAARELARIKRIVMFACPNTGSEFMLSVRKFMRFWRNPQERQLRPITRAVIEAQRAVLQHVVQAADHTDTDCPIPIAAYGGASDGIVPPEDSTWVFPLSGIVAGDHFSIVRPEGRQAQAFIVLKTELIAAGNPAEPARAAAGDTAERLGSVSIDPPYGKREGRLRGRDGLIASITSRAEGPRVHVLAGLGGSGKSRLALEIAHRAQAMGRQVWWVSATRINSGMREVANQLGAQESQVERAWRGAASATDLVWRLLNACPAPWLLIFDNADEPQHLGPSDGEVALGTGWLRAPTSSTGMVVVTSRDRNADTWGSWSTVHPVPPLDGDDGASMLIDLVGPVGGTFRQARELSGELGGLPLALRAAADYLKSVISTRVWQGDSPIRDFESYQQAVKDRFDSPISGRNHELDERLGFELMRTVSGISLDLLARRGLTQAAPLIKLFACLNIAPIPYHVVLDSRMLAESLLFTEFTAMQRPTVLTGLADLGLVDLHTLDGIEDPDLAHVLSMHPVVHGILRGDPDVEQHRTDYYGLSVRMLYEAIKDADPDLPEHWVRWGVIAPHSVEVAKAVLFSDPPVADRRAIVTALQLARFTARYLIVTGLVRPASELAAPIIDGCQSFGFHQDEAEILALRHERARIALEQGDPVAAEAELREVIAGRTQALGENHPDTLASGHKLAKAILEQGRFAEAEPLLRRIVRAENRVRGAEHSDTMVVRHSLARAILAQGRPAEAEAEIRDILRVRARHWSAAHTETLFARQTLARSLLEQNKIAEAEAELRDALLEAADHPDAPIALSLRQTLIMVLLLKGSVSQAITDLADLVADRRRVLGRAHPETIRTEQLLTRTQREIPHEHSNDRPVLLPRQAGPADDPHVA